MRSNRDRHAATRAGKSIPRLATPALALALVAPLIACEGSPADPTPAAALQAAGATSDQDSAGHIGHGLFRLLDELELSADQQAEVERIRTELRQQNESLHEQVRSTLGISDEDSPGRFALRNATDEQREALRPIFKQLHENRHAAVEQVIALLTAEQQETLDSLRAERAARWESRRRHAAGARRFHGPPSERGMLPLPESLDLTADQEAEIERIRTELREENQSLHEQIRSTLGGSDADFPRRFRLRELTDDQREALRPVFEQLRENHREAMEEVESLLTAEQQEALDSLREQRRLHRPGAGAAGFFRSRRSS